MARNLKALTQSEVDYINNKYDFEDMGKYIIVISKNGGIKIAHDGDKSFILSTPIRKLTISKEAIDLWRGELKDSGSLIDIQAAINSLVLTYQDTTPEDIDKQIVRGNSKIKII